MIHSKRRFLIGDIEHADELAGLLAKRTWTLCTGFRYRGLLFLNDSISEDGASEWAIYDAARYAGMHFFQQIETITFGWMEDAEAHLTILKLVSGELYTKMGEPMRIRTHDRNESCQLCA